MPPKVRLAACLLAALDVVMPAFTPVAFAADPSSTATAAAAPSTDTFVATAAARNLFELRSGKLALARTRSENVRTLANMMVTDHTAAAAKFEQVVADAGLAIPTAVLDSGESATLEDLRASAGDSFDKTYIDAQYRAYVDTIGMFEAYARKGDNARVRQFANELLPILQTHLDHVIKLRWLSR